MSSPIERSVFSANLHRLHAGFRFSASFEHAVINDGRRRRRRFLVDNGAFLGGRVSYDVIFARNCGLRKGRSDGERNNGTRKQKVFHDCLLQGC